MLSLAEVDYPFLNIFWSMIIFFVWVAWIWTVIAVLSDLYRRHDVGGWGKALWTLFVIVVPFLGVLIYLISNGHEMAQRNVKQVQAAQSQYEERVREIAGSADPASQIETAKKLHDAGTITDAEFEKLKAKALA